MNDLGPDMVEQKAKIYSSVVGRWHATLYVTCHPGSDVIPAS